MHRSDCYEIDGAIAQFTSAAAEKRQKSNRIERTISKLEQAVTVYERDIANQNCKARDQGSNYFTRLQQERGNVFRKTLRTDGLRNLLASETLPSEVRSRLSSLLDRLARLSSSTEELQRPFGDVKVEDIESNRGACLVTL